MLKKILFNEQITDIYLTGFMDITDGKVEFNPMMTFLYFEFNNVYLEFKSIEQYSKMQIRIVNSVLHDFEIDEDMMPGISSAKEIILDDSMSDNYIVKFTLFGLKEERDKVICDAICLILSNGQKLFLDPSFYFGINIGGENQENIWWENLSSSVPEATILNIVS